MKLQDIVRTKKKGLKRELTLQKKKNQPRNSELEDPIADGPGDDEAVANDDERFLNPEDLPHF